MTTFVPPVTFDTTRGFIAPTEQAILAGRQQDINVAFGGALNPGLSTPQGQIASSDTAIIGAADEGFVFMSNQVDPAYASGRMQDAIGRIYFIERLPAQPTVVSCLCTGKALTPIPIGSLGEDVSGNTYICTSGGTISSIGTVTLDFACIVSGPIDCPAGALNKIQKAIPGWDTILNASDGVLGRNVESRSQFEARRAASVALNARGSNAAILGAVLDVDDVLDAYVTDNSTGGTVTILGQSLIAHSVYVAAVGGTDLAVATAAWTKKSPGSPWNGNTTVAVTDNDPNYSTPPTYSVIFERPAALSIFFDVQIASTPNVPSNAAALIQAAIVNAFAGGDGGKRARIGDKLFASRFYAPVSLVGDWVEIVAIKIASANSPAASFTASVAATVMTVSAVASGTLAVGQLVVAPGVAEGTKIFSFGSGSGGTGTYNLTTTQTVSSEAMVSVAVNLDDLQVNINQAPTTSSADITVEAV